MIRKWTSKDNFTYTKAIHKFNYSLTKSLPTTASSITPCPIKPSKNIIPKDLNLQKIFTNMVKSYRDLSQIYDSSKTTNNSPIPNTNVIEENNFTRKKILKKIHDFFVYYNIEYKIFFKTIVLYDIIAKENEKKNLLPSLDDVAIGALMLSIKFNYDENKMFSMKKFSKFYGEHIYTLTKIIDIERKALKTIDYYLNITTPMCFMEFFLLNGIIYNTDYLNLNEYSKIYYQTENILKNIMVESNNYLKYNFFYLACSVVAYCRQMFNLEKWPNMLNKVFNIKFNNFQNEYNAFFNDNDNNKYNHKKYNHKTYSENKKNLLFQGNNNNNIFLLNIKNIDNNDLSNSKKYNFFNIYKGSNYKTINLHDNIINININNVSFNNIIDSNIIKNKNNENKSNTLSNDNNSNRSDKIDKCNNNNNVNKIENNGNKSNNDDNKNIKNNNGDTDKKSNTNNVNDGQKQLKYKVKTERFHYKLNNNDNDNEQNINNKTNSNIYNTSNKLSKKNNTSELFIANNNLNINANLTAIKNSKGEMEQNNYISPPKRKRKHYFIFENENGKIDKNEEKKDKNKIEVNNNEKKETKVDNKDNNNEESKGLGLKSYRRKHYKFYLNNNDKNIDNENNLKNNISIPIMNNSEIKGDNFKYNKKVINTIENKKDDSQNNENIYKSYKSTNKKRYYNLRKSKENNLITNNSNKNEKNVDSPSNIDFKNNKSYKISTNNIEKKNPNNNLRNNIINYKSTNFDDSNGKKKFFEKERNANNILQKKYDSSRIRQSFTIHKSGNNNSNNKEKIKYKGENKIKYNNLIKHKLLICDSLHKRKNVRAIYD
jgi:hypothetical protein